ncbi:MAG: hypothetical protein ACI4M6_02695 [Christensenellaceae bacterium]
MKKLLFIVSILLVFIAATLSGCSKNIDFTDKISQLRTEIYYGKTDNLEIFGYLEQRECPLATDGKVDAMKNYLILKIDNNGTLSGSTKAKVALDKEYDVEFDFKPERDCFVSTIEIATFPDSQFNIVFGGDGANPVNVKLDLSTPADMQSYKKALTACEKFGKDVLTNYETNQISYEVHIRLVNSLDNYYWYVAFCDIEFTHAYLLDGKNNLISQKSIKNG